MQDCAIIATLDIRQNTIYLEDNFMARQWEKFTGGPTVRGTDHLHVTLNSKGVIMMNRKAFEELGKPKAAVLFIDKESSVIGISPAHEKLREAFPVIPKGGISYWHINAMPFCRHYGIQMSGTEVFTSAGINAQGLLELDLRTTRLVFGGYRRKNKARREAERAAAKKAT